MNLFLRIAAALACVMGLAATRAAAEEGANPSLQKEVDSYLAETAPQAADTTFKAFWKNGLQFETSDKAFTAHVGGRILFDQAWFGSDDYGGANKQDSWYFREAFLTTEGTMYTNGIWKAEIDFSTGAVQIRDLYLGLKNLGPAGTFRGGSFKVGFTLGDMTSLLFSTFMERAAPVSAFAPSYQDGFQAYNNFFEKKLLVMIGVFKTSANGTATDNGGYGVSGRFVTFFLEDADSHRVLQIGVDFVYAGTPSGTQQFRARPDIGTGARFVDTGAVAADEVTLFDFEVLFTWKKLHAQAEFIWAQLGGAAGPEPTYSGYYVEVAYWIKGGRPNWNKDKKTLDRPVIETMLHTGTPGHGAWQIGVRYDSIDLSDSGVTGGQQDAITFGLNWWWNTNMVLKFNIIWADITDGGPFGTGNMTVFGTRLQVDF